MLGFVASDGTSQAELREIPDAPKFAGTPVIAGAKGLVLVAFAGREAPDAAWQLYVSLSQAGASPGPACALIAARLGSAISPAVAALSEGRWLVQWTEGDPGQTQVHVQSIAADLSALGERVLVSPKGANAGQGSLVPIAGGAAALFILTTAGQDELWGATLACP